MPELKTSMPLTPAARVGGADRAARRSCVACPRRSSAPPHRPCAPCCDQPAARTAARAARAAADRDAHRAARARRRRARAHPERAAAAALAVPELKTSMPLSPPPALAVRIETAPLVRRRALAAAQRSPHRQLAPCSGPSQPQRAARRCRRCPAVTLTSPPPAVATPSHRDRARCCRSSLVPELKTSSAAHALVARVRLRITIAPLVVAVPSPDAMLTAPPVCTVLRPASRSHRRPRRSCRCPR